MERVAVLIVVVMSGALAFAQAPTPPNSADHVQHQVKFLTTLLSLNAAQQQQPKKIFASSASNETAIHNNLKTTHESLRTAFKNTDSAGIEEAFKHHRPADRATGIRPCKGGCGFLSDPHSGPAKQTL